MVRLLDANAPALLVEVTGRVPRGEELPESHTVSMRCRSFATMFGVDPMRIFVDPPDGERAQLAADSRLVLCLGKKLAAANSPGELAFAVCRQFSFMALGISLAAVVNGNELCAILEAVVDEHCSEALADLRRRVTKPLARRTRKELERIAVDQQVDLNRAGIAWHAEEHRAADRIALATSRDLVTALIWASGSADPAIVRRSGRAADLIRWLATESAWRVHARLASG
jgi:hypothetical protein